MDIASAIASASPTTTDPTGAGGNDALAGLGSRDFLSLLITQLRSQDPLDPVSNQELLSQISSIRDIEMSTTMTQSLRDLTGQQRFASASSLIGQFVTGTPGEDGVTPNGIVVGVRFLSDGQPMLQLADGGELPVSRLSSIEAPAQAAERLIGQAIVGVDRRDPSKPQVVRGVVSGVGAADSGEVMLELDTGHDLRFRDFVGLAPAEAA